MAQSAELKSNALVKEPTLRAQEYNPNSGVIFANIANGSPQRFRFHYHAAAAAKGPVIGSPMGTDGIIANIDDPDFNEFAVYGFTNNGLGNWPCHHTGEYGQNVNDHLVCLRKIDGHQSPMEIHLPDNLYNGRNEDFLSSLAYYVNVVASGFNNLLKSPQFLPLRVYYLESH
jgi:hypothetical protein